MSIRTFCGLYAAMALLTLQAVADARISSLNIFGDSVELTIQTTPGTRYQVQCCFDLVEGKWIDLENRFVALESSSLRTYAAFESTCYFRALKVMDQSSLEDGKIHSLSVAGDNTELTIQTVPGKRYQVQYCFNLLEGEWFDLDSSFEAVNSSSLRTVTTTADTCFFRVLNVVEPINPTNPPPSLPRTQHDGKIRAIRVAGDSAVLTIDTTSGTRYQVQCCFDLIEGEWFDIDKSFEALTSTSLRTVAATADKCYFRILKVMEPNSQYPPPPLPPSPPSAPR